MAHEGQMIIDPSDVTGQVRPAIRALPVSTGRTYRRGMSAAAVIALVMDRLNVHNARQLADALGMDDIDRERRVRRWINGESSPSFAYAMLMLSRAGLLADAAERAWASPPRSAAEEAAAAARAAEAAANRLRRHSVTGEPPRRERGTG